MIRDLKERIRNSLRVRSQRAARWLIRLLLWPVLDRWPRRSSGFDILLVCNSSLMAEYLRDFMVLFEADPGLCFKVAFGCPKQSADEERRMHELLPIPEVRLWWAYAKRWDLAITADHPYRTIIDTQRIPLVLYPHGSKAKCPDGNDEEYGYGRHAFDRQGRLHYVSMFEERQSDRDNAVAANPLLKDAIAVVGSLWDDRLLELAKRRDAIRQEFGFEPEDTVVFVLSTWGPNSVCHVMGDGLVREMQTLQGKYKFILSAHPNEYRPRFDGKRTWGECFNEQRQYGLTVREPADSWMPYMVASDIVVSDFTSLIRSAALLKIPIILTPVPGELVWTKSVGWQVRQFAPVLRDAADLDAVLADVKKNYPFEKLRNLAATICPHAGEAAERMRKEVYRLLHRD